MPPRKLPRAGLHTASQACAKSSPSAQFGGVRVSLTGAGGAGRGGGKGWFQGVAVQSPQVERKSPQALQMAQRTTWEVGIRRQAPSRPRGYRTHSLKEKVHWHSLGVTQPWELPPHGEHPTTRQRRLGSEVTTSSDWVASGLTTAYGGSPANGCRYVSPPPLLPSSLPKRYRA